MGAHACNPDGDIVYSSSTYINKHMAFLGLTFLTNKLTERYKRAEYMRKFNMATHYTEDVDKIKELFTNYLNNCKMLE